MTKLFFVNDQNRLLNLSRRCQRGHRQRRADRHEDAGVGDLAQLASRLFLPVGMGMRKCLNDESEGDEGQGNSQYPNQVLPTYQTAPHSRY